MHVILAKETGCTQRCEFWNWIHSTPSVFLKDTDMYHYNNTVLSQTMAEV